MARTRFDEEYMQAKEKALALLAESETEFAFDVPASVFESGDNMFTVIWTTTMPACGYVEFTKGGKSYYFSDQTGGTMQVNTVHAVRVPKDLFYGCTYTYASRFVAIKFDYDAVQGKTVRSEPVTFTEAKGNETLRVLTLSDIHGDFAPVQAALSSFKEKADLIVLNGDISSSLIFPHQFPETVLTYAHALSGGKIPVAYTRGNHETRGKEAAVMPGFFRTASGQLRFTFRCGPLWAIVLDGGEDKPDDHIEYSGLVDFNGYIAEETEWLNGLAKDEDDSIACRLAFCHYPDVTNRYGHNWSPKLAELGVQALVCGHTHSFELHCTRFNTDAGFATVIEGGRFDKAEIGNAYIATMLCIEPNGRVTAESYRETGEKVADEIIL